MERRTIEQRPDGTIITTTEKSGLVVRDVIFGVAGTVGGLFMGGISVPIIGELLPVAVKANPMISKAAIGLGSFTVGEITEHSIVRALSDIAEASDAGCEFAKSMVMGQQATEPQVPAQAQQTEQKPKK